MVTKAASHGSSTPTSSSMQPPLPTTVLLLHDSRKRKKRGKLGYLSYQVLNSEAPPFTARLLLFVGKLDYLSYKVLNWTTFIRSCSIFFFGGLFYVVCRPPTSIKETEKNPDRSRAFYEIETPQTDQSQNRVVPPSSVEKV